MVQKGWKCIFDFSSTLIVLRCLCFFKHHSLTKCGPLQYHHLPQFQKWPEFNYQNHHSDKGPTDIFKLNNFWHYLQRCLSHPCLFTCVLRKGSQLRYLSLHRHTGYPSYWHSPELWATSPWWHFLSCSRHLASWPPPPVVVTWSGKSPRFLHVDCRELRKTGHLGSCTDTKEEKCFMYPC